MVSEYEIKKQICVNTFENFVLCNRNFDVQIAVVTI